jgi:putative transcriptional regulator
MKYIAYTKYMMIEINIDDLLEQRARSFYWLSKETGISYSTLWRLKKGKAMGINFVTLEKLCAALECEPGNLLKIATETGPATSVPKTTPTNKQ